jgi:hypothetical protein
MPPVGAQHHNRHKPGTTQRMTAAQDRQLTRRIFHLNLELHSVIPRFSMQLCSPYLRICGSVTLYQVHNPINRESGVSCCHHDLVSGSSAMGPE